MKCLVEQGVFDNQDEILKTLAEMKISHSLWDHKSYPPYDPKVETDVFFLGSTLTAQNIKNAKYPYHISIGDDYDYSHFGAHIKEIFNWAFLMGSAGSILNMYERRNKSLDGFNDDVKMFFRSNSGIGRLSGGTRTSDEIVAELKNLFKDEIVVMAEENDITDEYRCFVSPVYHEDGTIETYKVLTSSSYILNGERSTDYKPLDSANQAVLIDLLKSNHEYFPPKIFACDVHIDSDGMLTVLDINTANCSKFYGCDLKAFFDGVKRIVDET